MEKKVRSAKMLAQLFDSQFEVAGLRFGLDPVINTFPVIGNFIGLMLSLYIFRIAGEIGVSNLDKARMIFNIIIDFILGAIPFLGIFFDLFLKANLRNIKILEKYSGNINLNDRIIEGQFATD